MNGNIPVIRRRQQLTSLQDGLNEVLRVFSEGDVWRERVRVRSDALVRCLNVRGFERRFADKHRVQDDTQRPNVNLEGKILDEGQQQYSSKKSSR